MYVSSQSWKIESIHQILISVWYRGATNISQREVPHKSLTKNTNWRTSNIFSWGMLTTDIQGTLRGVCMEKMRKMHFPYVSNIYYLSLIYISLYSFSSLSFFRFLWLAVVWQRSIIVPARNTKRWFPNNIIKIRKTLFIELRSL